MTKWEENQTSFKPDILDLLVLKKAIFMVMSNQISHLGQPCLVLKCLSLKKICAKTYLSHPICLLGPLACLELSSDNKTSINHGNKPFQ